MTHTTIQSCQHIVAFNIQTQNNPFCKAGSDQLIAAEVAEVAELKRQYQEQIRLEDLREQDTEQSRQLRAQAYARPWG